MNWLTKLLARMFIKSHWGKRCDVYQQGCPCCESWRAYDDVFEYDRSWPDGFFGLALRAGRYRQTIDPDKHGDAK